MGLAIAIPGECSACYLRTVDQARRRRDASLSRTGSKAAQVTSTNQRGGETTLARFVARNWCASRAGCLVLAGGGFFTELFGDGPRLAQATCVDFVVNRSRVQRALGGVLRCFVGQARTPCRVRRRSGLNHDVGVRVLCAARHASTAADYACHSRRIDCSRNDVRPSGRFHHRAISNSRAICGFFDGLHAGRNRRRWNRARNFRHSIT